MKKKSNSQSNAISKHVKSNHLESKVRDTRYDRLLFLDKKSKIFIGFIIGLYIGCSMMKVHSSSTPIWSQLLGNKYGKDLIWGTPKGIRQDDWLIGTSVIASHFANSFESNNYSIGGGESVFAWSFLPMNSNAEVFRPRVWSYFWMDLERAFAFDVNSKVTVLLLGSFLFLLILTRNHFYLSAFGSIWLYLSGVTVWWNCSIGSMLGYGLITIVAFLLFLNTQKRLLQYILAFIILCATYSFVLNLYPPIQIPVILFLIILFIGLVLQFKMNLGHLKLLSFESGLILAVGLIFGGLLYNYFHLSAETVHSILSTVYPGKRSFDGGDLPFYKIFSESFILFFSDSNFPKAWTNISESSNVLMFFPVVIPSIIYNFYNRKFDYLEISYFIIFIVSFSYMFIGWPEFLCKITLFEMVQDFRVLAVFGYFNVLFTIYFLSKQLKSNGSISIKEGVVVAIFYLFFSYFIMHTTNKLIDNFFSNSQVVLCSAIYAISSVFLFFSRNWISSIAFCVLILTFNIPNFAVNPIVKGLKPMINNELTKQINSIPNLDKEAKWAVFGNYQIADLLKPTGIKLFNGTKFPPNLNEMRTLDASAHADSCYNRYAHIALSPFITNSDSIVMMVPKFENGEPINDLYYVYMDPCSSKLKDLGVKYFIFTNKPSPIETRCMDLISQGKVMIYQLK